MDPETGAATLVGTIKNTHPLIPVTLNLNGGDIAFDPSTGELNLWTNLNRGGNAKRGLWKLTLPAVGGVVSATYIGQPALADWAMVSGLAIRLDGKMFASTAASRTIPSRIVEVNKATGAFGDKYNMKKGGVASSHQFGDLAIGDPE